MSNPDLASDNVIQVASLLDVVATKLKTIQERAQARDYIDNRRGAQHWSGFGCGPGCCGSDFREGLQWSICLKALTYFADGDLPALNPATRKQLRAAALSVDLASLPNFQAMAGIRGGKA